MTLGQFKNALTEMHGSDETELTAAMVIDTYVDTEIKLERDYEIGETSSDIGDAMPVVVSGEWPHA